MNDEVYVWSFVPFEYDPAIAILLALLSANFSFILPIFRFKKEI